MDFLPQPDAKMENAHKQESTSGNPTSQGIWAVSWAQENIVTGAVNGSLKVWGVNNDKIEQKLEITNSEQSGGIVSIATTQDGTKAIACHQNSTIRFFDIANEKKEIFSLKPGLLEAWSICLSPGDDVLASGNTHGAVNLWSMQDDHEIVAKLETQNKHILSTCFSADNKLASASIDGVVNLFDLVALDVAHKLKAHALPIRSIMFSPNGDLIYTASDDRHVCLYDLRSGKLVNSFSHAGMALVVDASPDSRHFAVGSADCSVSLWDLGMQKRVAHYNTEHKDQVWGLKFDKTN
jgi:WD repeat-containing protein 61